MIMTTIVVVVGVVASVADFRVRDFTLSRYIW